jgi:hypothetical protein
MESKYEQGVTGWGLIRVGSEMWQLTLIQTLGYTQLWVLSHGCTWEPR